MSPFQPTSQLIGCASVRKVRKVPGLKVKCSNLKKTVQDSLILLFPPCSRSWASLIRCWGNPERMKNLFQVLLPAAFWLSFLDSVPYLITARGENTRKSTAVQWTRSQPGLYLHLGGWRKAHVLRSYCIQFQSCLERLVFSVIEVVKCKSFLEEKQGIALKIISMVLTFIYTQVFFESPGFLFSWFCSRLP